MTGSNAQIVNGIILITTFGCSRLIWGTYQSVLIYSDLWTAWSNNYSVDNANSGSFKKGAATDIVKIGGQEIHLPLWLALLYLSSNTVLSVLNFYWFNKMIVAVRKRFVPKQANFETLTRKTK